MISYFPTPYPDELFYSVMARYHKQSLNRHPKESLFDIYGQTVHGIRKLLSFNIHGVVGRLKWFNYISAEEIIRDHTLFNFYSAMNPNERDRVYREIYQGKKQSTRVIITGINFVNEYTEYLRFCPTCIREDIKQYGETYWRRSHQTPAAFVCTKHLVMLQDSRVKISDNTLVAASLANCVCNNIYKKFTEKETLTYLILLSKQNEYLVNNEVNINFLKSNNTILSLFRAKGLLERYGTINKGLFLIKLYEFYGYEFFEHVKIKPKEYIRLFANYYDSRFRGLGIVEKLIMIIFLFENVQTFIKAGTTFSHVHLDIPCTICKQKNPFNISRKTLGKREINLLEINCNCGFISRRIFGDDDVYKNSLWIETDNNEVWKKTINSLIYEKGISISEVSAKFGVSEIYVEQLVERSSETLGKLEKETFREKWKDHLTRFSYKSEIELIYYDFPTYCWLFHFDYEWLYNINSDREDFTNTKSMFWQKRDRKIKEYSREVLHRSLLYGYGVEDILDEILYPILFNPDIIFETYMSRTVEYSNKFKALQSKELNHISNPTI
ncbi:TnsD family Tn7-like transposition protein [Bacillus sp. 31A1R]|uniref:TnsD family Tn7-like transposition protein n=1 Tax=Robertmurraya mangrovi TaxID=3098077 RepID=A0ABU5J493_9BACI|nr:TnsD family Tn7-like transposition protein [Bacillus sp. 31A1R]MDZ5474166.1 TnsD family Tn7-like transposition protein [Bacillus sp. 31A1R]